jgi:hypothetical protein
MKTCGKREVAEQVLIAALSAVVCTCIQWGFDAVRARREAQANNDAKKRKKNDKR